MISFRTTDGSQYDLSSGVEHQTVERYGRIWIYYKAGKKEKYINIDHIVLIMENPEDIR